MENTSNTSCIFQATCVKSLCEITPGFCRVQTITLRLSDGCNHPSNAMPCLDTNLGHRSWTVFDAGRAAQLGVTFEQSPDKRSSPESKTASLWLIVFAFQQNSLAQVEPCTGTTTATPRSGISPHTSLHSANVPLSALNFCCWQQLAAHEHCGAGTVFSSPLGTALSTLSPFSI